MKIHAQLAQNLIEFFYKDFASGYYTRTAKGFISHMNAMAQNGFEASWSLGGTSGNCYDDKLSHVSADPEGELDSLDDFLMEYYPNTSFLQYKIITRAINRKVQSHSDYYGGSTETAVKSLSYTDLDAAMVKGKVLSSEDRMVDFDELVKQKAYEYMPEKTKEIKAEAKSIDIDDIKAIKKSIGIVDQKKTKKPRETIKSEKPVPSTRRKPM